MCLERTPSQPHPTPHRLSDGALSSSQAQTTRQTNVRQIYADSRRHRHGGPVAINPFDLIVKRIVVKGFFLNHPDMEAKIEAALRETIPLVASGVIQVPIAATYPLSSLREAVLHAQRGGKVLLDLRETA